MKKNITSRMSARGISRPRRRIWSPALRPPVLSFLQGDAGLARSGLRREQAEHLGVRLEHTLPLGNPLNPCGNLCGRKPGSAAALANSTSDSAG